MKIKVGMMATNTKSIKKITKFFQLKTNVNSFNMKVVLTHSMS